MVSGRSTVAWRGVAWRKGLEGSREAGMSCCLTREPSGKNWRTVTLDSPHTAAVLGKCLLERMSFTSNWTEYVAVFLSTF